MTEMAGAGMDPSQLKTLCVKCGTNAPQVRYLVQQNVLQLQCRCCGYEWQELPLDHVDRKLKASIMPLRPVHATGELTLNREAFLNACKTPED